MYNMTQLYEICCSFSEPINNSYNQIPVGNKHIKNSTSDIWIYASKEMAIMQSKLYILNDILRESYSEDCEYSIRMREFVDGDISYFNSFYSVTKLTEIVEDNERNRTQITQVGSIYSSIENAKNDPLWKEGLKLYIETSEEKIYFDPNKLDRLCCYDKENNSYIIYTIEKCFINKQSYFEYQNIPDPKFITDPICQVDEVYY